MKEFIENALAGIIIGVIAAEIAPCTKSRIAACVALSILLGLLWNHI